ncbi:hypothetical protein V6N13_045896 [Hibiscus sabdariffa]
MVGRRVNSLGVNASKFLDPIPTQKELVPSFVAAPPCLLGQCNMTKNMVTAFLQGQGKLGTILSDQDGPTRSNQISNHALITQPQFINQTWNPVSLELKDTEVRAYRTDPVQVRSYHFYSQSKFKYHWLLSFL